jgi:hypothetical protein
MRPVGFTSLCLPDWLHLVLSSLFCTSKGKPRLPKQLCHPMTEGVACSLRRIRIHVANVDRHGGGRVWLVFLHEDIIGKSSTTMQSGPVVLAIGYLAQNRRRAERRMVHEHKREALPGWPMIVLAILHRSYLAQQHMRQCFCASTNMPIIQLKLHHSIVFLSLHSMALFMFQWKSATQFLAVVFLLTSLSSYQPHSGCNLLVS